MFFHLCFVLVLVAASNGQRSSPAHFDFSAPRANGRSIASPDDSAYRVRDNNNGGFISVPNQPIKPNPRLVLFPGDNGSANDPGYGREPIDVTENTAGDLTTAPNDFEHTTDSEGFDITTVSNDIITMPNDFTTVSNEIVIGTDPNIIHIGSNDTVSPNRDAVCKRRFGYYRVESSCDSYLECRDYQVNRRLCPDGMHFNPNAYWPEYPCGYPGDVPCRGRGAIQPPKATRDCPHQFGFYPVKDDSINPIERCSHYVMCSAGVAKVMNCPFGLAFNEATGRCDWPEQVPGCEDFLGFRCPRALLGEEDMVTNYKYNDGNCYYFWSCQQGRARVLSCDYGLAFDPDTGRCVDEDLVNCEGLEKPLEPEDDLSTPSPLYLM